jgi:hypothetical protein
VNSQFIMLANPPSVYSPIFNPAYFDYSDSAGGKYAVLSGANNFLGTNNFNGTIELTSTGMTVTPSAILSLQTGASTRFLNNVGATMSTEYYDVGQGLRKDIALGVQQITTVDADIKELISVSGIDFYGLRDMQYNSTYLVESDFGPAVYNIPTGGTCPRKDYNEVNLPAYIIFSGTTSSPRCVNIPLPSLVPVGTIFRILGFTINSTTPLYISINGGNTSGNVAYTNDVFEFANAIWPNTATDVFVRNNTSLVLSQSTSFISVIRSTGAAWAQFD